MKKIKIIIFFVFPILYISAYYSPSHAEHMNFGQDSILHKKYPVFNALLYKNKPDLSNKGLIPLRVIYAWELWEKGENREEPNIRKIMEVANKLSSNSIVCIDIEHWPVKGKLGEVKKSISKFKLVVSVIKQVNPTVKLGFYGIPPIRDYWRAIGSKGGKAYEKWINENTALIPMFEFVDIIFPSLYTFYPNVEGWKRYAEENIKQARRHRKPVYAFLWPQYHDSNKELFGTAIPAEFWRQQLETCRKYADGIVIWGGWQKDWDEYAPWWRETKKFLQSIK